MAAGLIINLNCCSDSSNYSTVLITVSTPSAVGLEVIVSTSQKH